jgi:ABC-type branched-subunit amino acid transport system ATPase component
VSLLEISKLSSGYGKVTVLHDVSLRVEPGEIVLLLGPNGAGKTSLLRAIAGHLPVESGRIELAGDDITHLDAFERSRSGVGYVPQDKKVFGSLSVDENLKAASLFRPDVGPLVEPILERFPRLRERQTQLASTLSGGERQMLAVGSAMAGDPRLVLLDEPTAGLAPRFVDEIVTWMQEVAGGGKGVIWVVEQDPEKVASAASRAYFMAGGEIRDEKPSADLTDPALLRRVLFDG